jgi:hypothetical protein
MMTIELSNEEYRNLLDLLYLGQWLLDAHDVDPDPDTEKYDELIQKIYSFAKAQHFDNYIVFDKEMKQYFTTRLYEESSMCHVFIDEYDNDTFWDELISRLTDRDIQARIKNGEINNPININERLGIAGPIEARYADEFEKSGLDNIVVRTDSPN